MEIKGFNFEGYIGKIIVDEFKKLRKEFDMYFTTSPCDVQLKFCTEERLIWDKIKEIRGNLSREKIRELLIDFENVRYGQFFDATFNGDFIKSGCMGCVMKINQLTIRIHIDRVNDFIMNHLDNIDIVMGSIKIGLRHEFGHIIDFIRYQGMSEDEFRKECDRRNKEIEAWYESVKGKQWSYDDICRYHQLETEAVANRNTNVDVEELLELDTKLNELDHTKLKTTLTITSEYEPLKEDDGDGERK
jgi:hypothetical protein